MDTHGCLAKECRYVQDKSSLQELPVTAQGPSVRYRVNILNLEFDVASYLTVLTYSECARECVQLYIHMGHGGLAVLHVSSSLSRGPACALIRARL